MYNFKPQKVLSLNNALSLRTPKITGVYMLTQKWEGWYVYTHFNAVLGKWGAVLSSAGRPIPSLEWIPAVLDTYPKPHEDVVLIAEAYLEDTPFHILNGLLNRSVGDYLCKDVVFKCHDLVHINHTMLPAHTRYAELQKYCTAVPNNNLVQFVSPELISTYNSSLWSEIRDRIFNKGGEGIVAKQVDSIYTQGKRNAFLLKDKLEETVDCLADRLEWTIGEKGNSALTLVSKRKNETEIRTVIARHSLIEQFTSDESSILGKVVTIKCMQQYEEGTLRQPVFSCCRPDKEVTDYE